MAPTEDEHETGTDAGTRAPAALGPPPASDDDAPATPHDKIFKVVFGEPAHAAVVLRAALPPPLAAALDWERLTPGSPVIVGPDLREGSRDLLFRTSLLPAPAVDAAAAPLEVGVDLIFEHASAPRPRLRLRLNGYLQRGWEEAERKPRPEPRAPRPLPVILPVVLHQGPRPWTIPQLVDLYELTPAQAALVAPFTPTFAVAMFDLGRWTHDALEALPPGVARLALAALKAARTDADLIELLADMHEDLQAARAAGSSQTLGELFSYTAWVRDEVPDATYFEKVGGPSTPRTRRPSWAGSCC